MSATLGTRRPSRSLSEIARTVTALNLCVLAAAAPGCVENDSARSSETPIRVAHLPNLTQAPVLVARARGDFERALSPHPVKWKLFNAGPLIVEALFAEAVDLAYLGPAPAINGFVRSKGQALRISSGLVEGGSAFVVRNGSGLADARNLKGRRLTTPQPGNTQDVALRHWIRSLGLDTVDRGGDVVLFSVPPSDQLVLFQRGEVDGAWTVEPWVTRLVREGNGEILLDEAELWPEGRYATTVLATRPEFVTENADLLERWLEAQELVLAWMAESPDSARSLANRQMEILTGYALSPELLEEAWKKLSFTSEPCTGAMLAGAELAFEIGFLGNSQLSLEGLFDLRALNKVRIGRGERLVR